MLWDQYTHPLESIKYSYGSLSNWISWEMYGIGAIPNLALHLMEGMVARKLTEYYHARGLSPAWSRVLGVTTTVFAQQVNEIAEARHVWRGDALADTLFWNNLGLILFQFDAVAGLFSNGSVQMHYWPGQPIVDVRDGALYQNGEEYLLRLSSWSRVRPAILWGTANSGLGCSVRTVGRDWVTVMAMLQGDVVPDYPYRAAKYYSPISYAETRAGVKQPNDAVGQGANGAVRLAWDRDGNLLSTLDIGFWNRFDLTANVYPLAPVGPLRLGGFLHIDPSGGSGALGVTFSALSVAPGLRL